MIITVAHPDGTATIVKWRLPAKFASLGGDVGHLKGSLGPRWAAKHAQFNPFFIEPVAIFSSNFVLAGIPSQGICAFKEGVVVAVGDLDPLVLLGDDILLLLGDVALPLGPRLVRHRLADHIHGPAVGSTNLITKSG